MRRVKESMFSSVRRRTRKPEAKRERSRRRREFSSKDDWRVWNQTRTTRATMQRYWEMETESFIALSKSRRTTFAFITISSRKVSSV